MINSNNSKASNTTKLDEHLIFVLLNANMSVMNAFLKNLNYSGITEATWQVLVTLYEREQLIVTELAKLTMMKQPTLTKLLDRLVRADFVSRKHSNSDRRKIELKLTEKGLLVAEKLIAKSIEFEQELLTINDRESMKLLLKKLIEKRNADRPASQIFMSRSKEELASL